MSEIEKQPDAYFCTVHKQDAKWQCGICGQAVCKSCGPRGLNYQVYHPACIEKARTKMDDQQQHRSEVEAPSIGVKLFSWTFIIGAMILFGLGLFFLIYSFVGQQVPIRALLSGPVSPTIDSIPGARSGLMWIGSISLIISMVIAILGIGLLNCVAAARRTVVVLSWLHLITSVIAWIIIGLIGQGFWDIPVISILAIWFFSKRRVKQQFEQVL